MEQFLKRIENLLTVKSIVTLALTAVFACQAVRGEVSQDFMRSEEHTSELQSR